MTIEQVPGTDLTYYLLAFDEDGCERGDDPDASSGRLSESVLEAVGRDRITDVFLISHGWKGDVPAAREQYNKWIAAMASCDDDRRAVRALRPHFAPLLIGLHWPSLPFGEEDFSSDAVDFGPATEDVAEQFIERAATTIADSPRARQALETIIAAAASDVSPPSLSNDVVEAFLVVNEEAGLESAGPAGAPGDDREDFDPERAYEAVMEDEALSFGSAVGGGILALLRQLSFWKMKKRACRFGEGGVARLLADLQQKAGEDRDVRYHLMGHSFGSIVVSAAVAGLGTEGSRRPVHSLFLVQGALSLWSFCSDIPVAPGRPGYFHSIVRDDKVFGPIVTTQSEHDDAVGRFYPLGAGVKRQIDYAPGELPDYGAIGSFGVHGPGIDSRFLAMLPIEGRYMFESGEIYNLDGSEFICERSGLSGAHSDIAKPEVAHAFWAAVMALPNKR